MKFSSITPIGLIVMLTGWLSTASAQNSLPVECKGSKLKVTKIKDDGADLKYLVQGTSVVEHGVCLATNSTFSEGFVKHSGYKGNPKDILPSVDYVFLTVSGLEGKSKYYANVYVINNKGDMIFGTSPTFILTGDPEASKRPDPSNGPKKEYYANGKLMREYTMRDGTLNGVYRMYSDSGFLITEQNMKDGQNDGFYRTFYKSGQLQSESIFSNGLPAGRMKEYYENANLKMESICEGEPPKQSCTTKSYYENGGLKSEVLIQSGEFVRGVKYDEQGRVTSEEAPGSNISYGYDEDGWRHISINGEKCSCSRCN
jgi:antitoxin component YwqK of YwqJK toxin-antitoxin module